MSAVGAAGRGDLVLPGGKVVMQQHLRFTATRSSGPGGQNVNKVATKVELRVALAELEAVIGVAAAARLRRAARSHLTAQDELILTCGTSRSQSSNRRACVARLRALLVSALRQPKVRKRTAPSAGSQQRRLEQKQQRALLKRQRTSKPSEW